jgi:hypothetical protein
VLAQSTQGPVTRAFSFAIALALVCAACARGVDDQAAYNVCLEAAKKEARFANAKFGTKEGSNIQASAGDADIRVNIPYELEGKKGLYQCIAAKQADGTYKVAF